METDELEADLRQALARRAAEVPQTSIDLLRRGTYRPRARNRMTLAGAGLVAATAAAVVAVTSLTASPQAGQGRAAAHSLRARLLAAIDATRGDILMTQSPPAPHTGSGYELTYPWYPRPGQQVTIRTIGWATNGKLWGEAESIFTMPAGHSAPAMNPVDGGTDFTVTRTFIVVYPARHAWAEWHHNTQIVELAVDAAGIRRQLANGQFKIIRRTVLDGHKAIELGMTGLNPSMTGLHTTAALIWVDAASYLPLRQVLRFSTGRVDATDFEFLPPTAANLAKLRIVIPPGYHRTWLRPGQGLHRRHR
jgi:hypothetical protein